MKLCSAAKDTNRRKKSNNEELEIRILEYQIPGAPQEEEEEEEDIEGQSCWKIVITALELVAARSCCNFSFSAALLCSLEAMLFLPLIFILL